jgi:hypothetical protein
MANWHAAWALTWMLEHVRLYTYLLTPALAPKRSAGASLVHRDARPARLRHTVADKAWHVSATAWRTRRAMEARQASVCYLLFAI